MGQLYFSKNNHASARTGKTQAIQADKHCRDRGSREDADVAPLGHRERQTQPVAVVVDVRADLFGDRLGVPRGGGERGRRRVVALAEFAGAQVNLGCG